MLAALLTLAISQTGTVVLYRGAEAIGSDTKYWSVEDTQVDKADPVRSAGQGLVLFLGRDKRAFLRFGDLRRALGPNKRIVSAKLTLTPAYVTSEGALTLKRFAKSWHESPGTGALQPLPIAWSTSWDHRHFGTQRWRDGGREFMAQTASASVTVATSANTVVIEGLAADLQAFYDRPYDNFGWALDYSGEAAFNSAENRLSGPRLEIVTETVGEKTGADLSVTYIERTPKYKRYDNRGDAYTRIDGVAVMTNPGEATSKKWPSDGEEVTYTAHVRNVGTEGSGGFSYEWSEKLNLAGTGEFGALAPGQETTVTFKTRFKNDRKDHRTQPISLRITPKGPDAVAANDFLEIQSNALALGIYVDQAFYDRFAASVNALGSKSFEDWVQWQVRMWNEVFMRHSRFSFAEDGIRASVRIDSIKIVPNGTLAGDRHTPAGEVNLDMDAEWGFAGGATVALQSIDRSFIHAMSGALGLTALNTMNVNSGAQLQLQINGRALTRGAVDPYAGLMGGGDTRNDLLVPAQIAVPYAPTSDVVFASPLFAPTDLYSRTDAAALNSTLGFRRGYYGEYLYSMPAINVLRVADRNGVLLGNGTLQFYQMSGGQISNTEPTFVVEFTNGVGRLPSRPTGLASPLATLTGHTLAPNPFGRLSVDGSNGVFLIRLDYAGQTEFTWLKAWQLFDMFARGNKTVTTNELRFNVTQKPLKEQDWALRKTAIDSINSDGSNVAALIDGDNSTAYVAGNNAGDWVEIDIGRDRPIGEVKFILAEGKTFWERFDILVYGTGQTVAQARTFAGEESWTYASAMQRDGSSLAYRAAPQTVRFIRLVNKSGGGGAVAGVEVRETEFGQ
jgi:hypothetical protein